MARRSRRGPVGSEHQPVGALGKGRVVEGLAEELVVGLEVLDVHPALGQAGRTAGLEDVEGLVGETLGYPTPDGAATQPVVLEVAEDGEVVVTRDLLAGIEVELGREVEPERTAGGWIEVPGDHLPHVRIEMLTCLLNPGGEAGFR